MRRRSFHVAPEWEMGPLFMRYFALHRKESVHKLPGQITGASALLLCMLGINQEQRRIFIHTGLPKYQKL